MGVLDKKTRFIDLVVTQEGRRQIAAGKLRAEFASLSDCNAFYSIGDRDDVSQRLYFEVMERPENSIVLEKDDSGRIINLDFSPTGSIIGDNLFSGSIVSNVLEMKAVTGSQFASIFAEVTGSALKHFKNNYFIGTNDPQGRDEFELNIKETTFTINNLQPFAGSPLKEIINVNDAEPFFMDPKLTHLPNFKYLPPVNTDGTNYGNFVDIRSTKLETWEQIKARLGNKTFDSKRQKSNDNNLKANFDGGNAIYKSQNLLKNGKLPMISLPPKESTEIKFVKTTTDNNLLLQIYEDSIGAKMKKLDIIDAGIFPDSKDPNKRYEKRVFYAGKIYLDDYKAPTFINIFTIVMD
jgi:hypothetical protein